MGNPPTDGPQKLRRGWWDYVPNEHSNPIPSVMTKGNDQFTSKRRPSLLVTFSDKLRTCCGIDTPMPMTQEKLSKPERYGSRPQPTRTSSVIFAESPSDDFSSATRAVELPGVRTATPPPRPPSVMSRISKYMPRMRLLKKVLRDEVSCRQFCYLLRHQLNFPSSFYIRLSQQPSSSQLHAWFLLVWHAISFLVRLDGSCSTVRTHHP